MNNFSPMIGGLSDLFSFLQGSIDLAGNEEAVESSDFFSEILSEQLADDITLNSTNQHIDDEDFLFSNNDLETQLIDNDIIDEGKDLAISGPFLPASMPLQEMPQEQASINLGETSTSIPTLSTDYSKQELVLNANESTPDDFPLGFTPEELLPEMPSTPIESLTQLTSDIEKQNAVDIFQSDIEIINYDPDALPIQNSMPFFTDQVNSASPYDFSNEDPMAIDSADALPITQTVPTSYNKPNLIQQTAASDTEDENNQAIYFSDNTNMPDYQSKLAYPLLKTAFSLPTNNIQGEVILEESQSAPSITDFQGELITQRFNQVDTQEASTTLSPITTSVSEPLNASSWGQSMADRIHWVSNQNINQADIQINPRELGPVEAQIKMVDGKTDILLVSEHPEVRDAIEQSLPKLRELFETSHLDLANVSVADYSHNTESDLSRQTETRFTENAMNNKQTTQDVVEVPRAQRSRHIEGLVDFFA